MSRTPFNVIRAKLDGPMQRAISQHRKALLEELAREDFRKATASLPDEDKEAYRAAMRRELDDAETAKKPARPERKHSARAVAEAHFTTGREAA